MKKPEPERTKTSLALDAVIWRKMRVQALSEGRPAYLILDQLMRAYLQKKGVRP